MKVCRVLHDSAKSVEAVIQVDAGEVADVEPMARLVDGEIGHFGFNATLIKIGDPEPEYTEKLHFGKPDGIVVKRQFGYSTKPRQDEVRYYEVRVHRD